MASRISKLSCAALGLCLYSASSFAASSGNWQIGYFPSDAERNGCAMQADYTSGTRVVLVVRKDYNWALGFIDDSWRLEKGSLLDAAAYVDGQLIATGKAEFALETVAVLPLTGTGPFKALQTGHGLTIVTPRGTSRFSLAGTAKAMEVVLDCIATLKRESSEQVQAPPAEQQGNDDFAVVPREQAVVMVTTILNAAGASGYAFDPGSATPGHVIFTMPDGSKGLFVAARGSGTPTADTMAADAISAAASQCEGEFKSGKKSLPTADGSIIRQVILSCRKGGTAIIEEKTIVRHSDGFLHALAIFYRDDQVRPGDDAQRPSLVDAAMRLQSPR